jgi:thiol-disulfide isomerase/thioredoxin
MLTLFAASVALANGALLVDVPGADDDCCAQKVASILQQLPFAEAAGASFAQHRACVKLKTGVPADEASLRKALEEGGYPVAGVTPAPACPAELLPRKEPWDAHTGLDVKVVSRGDAVDVGTLASEGRFTVVDFGAPWCGPCFTLADSLAAYLRASADVGVRVVWLDAPDARASFALPAAKQHLAFATALPWLVVLDGRGKQIYAGTDLESATRAIEKRRGKRK